MRLSYLAGIVISSVLILGTGCEETSDSGGSSGTTTNTSSVSGDFTCCVNGDDYECDSSSDALGCLEGDFSGCDFVGSC